MEPTNKIIKRETAKIFPLNYLLTGEYIVQEGWNPNYVQIFSEKISRINVLGVIIKIENQNQFLLDDGTATIIVNCFSDEIEKQKLVVGDIILVIGRIRKINESLRLVCEIISKDQIKNNKKWFEYRKKYVQEMIKYFDDVKNSTDSFEPSNEIPEYIETPAKIEFEIPSIKDVDTDLETNLTSDKIIQFILKHDSQTGCSVNLITKNFGNKAE